MLAGPQRAGGGGVHTAVQMDTGRAARPCTPWHNKSSTLLRSKGTGWAACRCSLRGTGRAARCWVHMHRQSGAQWHSQAQEERHTVDVECMAVLPGAPALRMVCLHTDNGGTRVLCPAAGGGAAPVALRRARMHEHAQTHTFVARTPVARTSIHGGQACTYGCI